MQTSYAATTPQSPSGNRAELARYTCTVRADDADITGAVHHPRYLTWMNHAREAALGPSFLRDLFEDQGIVLLVHQCEFTVREPAHYGDELTVMTAMTADTEWRLTCKHLIARDGRPTVEATIELVAVDRDGRLAPLPRSLRERLLL